MWFSILNKAFFNYYIRFFKSQCYFVASKNACICRRSVFICGKSPRDCRHRSGKSHHGCRRRIHRCGRSRRKMNVKTQKNCYGRTMRKIRHVMMNQSHHCVKNQNCPICQLFVVDHSCCE